MKVVLDANIIIADPWLRGADFRWFSAVVDFGGWTLVVPRLVLDEAVNKYEEKLVAAAKELADAEQHVTKLLGKPLVATTRVNPGEQVPRYKAHVLARFRELGARILPYPQVTHRTLVKRALDRRRPFNEKGAGYRDALLWESVLALVDGKQRIAFVTNDSGDFFHREGGTHPDLVQDLGTFDSEAHPRLYRTLRDFMEQEATPQSARMDSMMEKLNTGGTHGPIDIKAIATTYLGSEVRRQPLDPKPFNPDAASACVYSVKRVGRVEVTAVRELSVREVMIDIVAECSATLEFTWEEDDELPWEVEDPDNQSYESATVDVSASFAVVLRDGSVKAVEVHSVGPTTRVG